MTQANIRISKFLSLVLRHKPEEIGITLDPAGWIDVDSLLAACAAHGSPITRDQLDSIVAGSDKQRFAFSEDRLRIRANQGHSVEVELGYAPAEPPEILYHGTAEKYVDSIRREGLLKRQRHHVHLSPTVQTAAAVMSMHQRDWADAERRLQKARDLATGRRTVGVGVGHRGASGAHSLPPAADLSAQDYTLLQRHYWGKESIVAIARNLELPADVLRQRHCRLIQRLRALRRSPDSGKKKKEFVSRFAVGGFYLIGYAISGKQEFFQL